uniref:Uncharacterized protein n=1 Tax=Cyprinus carpio TaxID=7962 RepID=A0A8C1GC89_CYPCA
MANNKTAHRKDLPRERLASEEKRAEETELFTKYYSERKGGEKGEDDSFKHIPCFYYRLPAEDEVLLQKLREESRALQVREHFIGLNLWFLLDMHQVPPTSADEAMISYESFLKVGEKKRYCILIL